MTLKAHKKVLLDVCQSLDKNDFGRLPFEQFRLGK